VAAPSRWLRKHAIGIPIVLWLVLLIVGPILIMFLDSFYLKAGYTIQHTLSAKNYLEFVQKSIYIPIFVKTIIMAFSVGLVSVILSYPVAYLIARKVTRFRNQLYMLVIVPLWVSYLVRIVAWKTILGRDGVINTLLMSVHVIKEPISALIYSPLAIYIALSYIALPFAFISIYASLDKIPRNLINAAHDLGADGPRTFLEVILPLSMPGVLNGFTMAFVTALGDYIIPAQLGGPNGIMFGNLIVSQFGYTYNWPLGSALGFILFTVTIAIILVSNRYGSREGFLE
jgi:spermidine/putrescine transport system permease protein